MASPVIGTLPPAPTRSDPANFNVVSETFVAELSTLVDDINAFGTFLNTNSTIIGSALNSTTLGQSTPAAGAFTSFSSTGISDIATVISLALSNSSVELGKVNSAFTIRRGEADQQLNISGGSTVDLGANIKLYAESHATLAKDLKFRSSGVDLLNWDNSADLWTFKKPVLFDASTAVQILANNSQGHIRLTNDVVEQWITLQNSGDILFTTGNAPGSGGVTVGRVQNDALAASNNETLMTRARTDAAYAKLVNTGLLRVVGFANITNGSSGSFNVDINGGFSSITRTATGAYAFVFDVARASSSDYIVHVQYTGGTTSRTLAVNNLLTTGFTTHSKIISSGGATDAPSHTTVYEVVT